MSKCLIIAGPNGAGKSTFASEFLPNEANCPRFINADLIAAGISPFRPDLVSIKAGRLLLNEIEECVAAGKDFAFESTLSGTAYVNRIRRWKERDFQIWIYYLRLKTADLALTRVKERVASGGHDIPEAVIRRRFQQSWKNFHLLYKPLANYWEVYDNSYESIQLIEKQNDTP